MSGLAILAADADGRIAWLAGAVRHLLGIEPEQAVGMRLLDALAGCETDEAEPRLAAALREARPTAVELSRRRAAGQLVRLAVEVTPVRDADHLGGTLLTVRELAEGAALRERGARADAALLREVLDTLPSGVIVFDAEERVLLANAAYRRMYPALAPLLDRGATLTALLRAGVEAGMYVHEVESDAPPEERDTWVAEVRDFILSGRSERVFRNWDGHWLIGKELRSRSGNLICIRTDVTSLRQSEEESRRLADHDPLTGLANRKLLFARLEALLRRRRAEDRPFCLVLLDIDHFKSLNDSLGHEAGDTLLREAGGRLGAALRPTDLAARLGGDEFAIILADLLPAQLEGVLDRIAAALRAPVRYGEAVITPTFSFGVACHPMGGDSAEDLYRSADAALYEAKSLGRDRRVIFDASLRAHHRRRERLACSLRAKLAAGGPDIRLFPIRDLATGAPRGFRVLPRHADGRGASASPEEIAALAGREGLAAPLGQALLRGGIAELHRRLAGRPATPSWGLLPLIAGHVCAPGFIDGLEALREAAGMSRPMLRLGLREEVFFGRGESRVVEIAGRLAERGWPLLLDDFGETHASFAILHRLPFRALALGRRLTAAAGRNDRDGMLLRSILPLCRGLGMETIAAGTATPAQAEELRRLGCDLIEARRPIPAPPRLRGAAGAAEDHPAEA